MEVCKHAYHQEEIDTADDSSVSPREVGHNVYILAYQVGNKASCYFFLILVCQITKTVCYFDGEVRVKLCF